MKLRNLIFSILAICCLSIAIAGFNTPSIVSAQSGFKSGAYFVNPTTLGNIPMCNQFTGGMCVYSPSNLVDNGTNLLYKGTPVTQVTTGVSSAVAGAGIAVSGATGAVTFTNTSIVAKGSGTFSAAASDAITVTGATSSSHCEFTPTNATAAADLLADYISAKATNSVTITHTATTAATGTVDVLCTLN
jgi:hypothetical protein